MVHGKIKIDVRLFLLCGLAVLVLAANILLVIYYKNTRSEIEKGYINALKNEYEIIMGVYSYMADSVFHLHIDKPEIKDIFAKGVAATDPAEKDRYRKLLFDRLSSLYNRLGQYDFRQLHFHEGNNRSYLRFHRPGKYGDDLTEIRYSVAYANREKKFIRGFEEGAIFNGYRFVYPVFVGDKHVGSVEVSVSMNTVIRQLSERFNKEAQFIILKSQVAKKVFLSEQPNYLAWFVDDAYLLDRTISDRCILSDRIIPIDASRIKNKLTANRETGRPFCIEIDVDSEPRLLTFLPIKNFVGKNVAYIFEVSDSERITDLDLNFYFVSFVLISLFILLVLFTIYYRLSQNKIERLATFDALTNVYVRGVLMQVIETEHERYKRYQAPFSLIMIDVDHFKNINDTYGHNVGDIVLAGIAEIMKRNIRKSDCVGRYGGEEFIVLLPETDAKNAAMVAEKLREKISAHSFHDIGTVTVSCGVVEVFEQAASPEVIINEADKKLYAAKHQGRNRVVV